MQNEAGNTLDHFHGTSVHKSVTAKPNRPDAIRSKPPGMRRLRVLSGILLAGCVATHAGALTIAEGRVVESDGVIFSYSGHFPTKMMLPDGHEWITLRVKPTGKCGEVMLSGFKCWPYGDYANGDPGGTSYGSGGLTSGAVAGTIGGDTYGVPTQPNSGSPWDTWQQQLERQQQQQQECRARCTEGFEGVAAGCAASRIFGVPDAVIAGCLGASFIGLQACLASC